MVQLPLKIKLKPYEAQRLWDITQGECVCGYVSMSPIEAAHRKTTYESMYTVPVTEDGYDTFFYVKPRALAMLEAQVLVDNFDIVCASCYQIWEEQEVGLWTSQRVGVRPRSKQSKVACKTS